MRRSISYTIAALVIVAGAATQLIPSGDTPAPAHDISCAGPIDAAKRILVLGDSWAAGTKLHAGMLSKLGDQTRICSSGYPGAMTGEIVGAYKRDRAAIEQKLGGQPHATIVIAGLNDAATSHGAAFYLANLQTITRTVSGNIFVLDLPFFDRSSKQSETTRIVKDVVYSCLFNGCRIDTFWDYRAAAAELQAERIPYEPFLPSFHRSDYVHGIHLTAANYTALGGYIADYIATRTLSAKSDLNP